VHVSEELAATTRRTPVRKDGPCFRTPRGASTAPAFEITLAAEALRRFVPVPEVVILILFGIILGPYVLGLAHTNTIVTALSDFGLTFLMFLAGTELDLATMREGHLGRAAISWAASLVIALAVGVASMRRASFSTPSSWRCA
jgi:Kef-type K+ transport system membrane component KefB